MNVERLLFDHPDVAYSSRETSIHVARYQLAKPFVAGKKVLDIACGEGYGSFLLKQWGARQVLGVDIAEDAINSARKNFLTEGVAFVCGNAETIELDASFDLIVSLETIEHVADQQAFLTQLKRLLAPNGMIILSCPNDYWAWSFPDANPYHLRQYTFKEFSSISEQILGKASTWLIGTNIFGYGNFVYHPDDDSIAWCKSPLLTGDVVALDMPDVLMCYNQVDSLPTAENSLYYVGIWGGEHEFNLVSANLFPIKPFKADINTIEQDNHVLERQLLEHRDAMQSMEAMIRDRDEAIAAQTIEQDNHVLERQLLEHRDAMQSMEAMIRDRDNALAAQACLLEERFGVMQSMEKMIDDRDEAIAAQARLLEERWRAMQSMEAIIRERDEAMAAQAQMLEERWRIMQSMEAKISERDVVI